MAKGRKPAIDGLARPQGILDDVVYPIVQKAARKVGNVSFTSNLPRNARTKITRKASSLESKMAQKRMSSYIRKSEKADFRAEKALEKSYTFAGPYKKRNVKAMKRLDAAYRKQSGKTYVNFEKANELHGSGRNVRKAAQRARKEIKKR